MAMKVDLEKFSLKELQDLRDDVIEAIQAVEEREKTDTREKMALLAQKAGFSIEELFSIGAGRGGRRRGVSSKPKKPYPPPNALYRDPSDPDAKPWTGRGKRPGWLVKHLSHGRSLAEFKVGA